MVSVMKNQLLKHLSRFTKNLSSDKINFSKVGEGELSNLELDEIILTDLLELPSWLRITKAWCNRVSFKIQWMKLKNVPIVLSLDELDISVETCEELRSLSAQAGLSSYATIPGKYSFIHKIIDGITVLVNVVNIKFNSPAFIATVQVSKIVVQSKNRKWEAADLQATRLKDPDKKMLLIFKELSWQTVKIEAKSTKDKNLSPLRLITNQARCRIIIKKRLADAFIMGSRLVIILDDLLWVFTDSQLKAALHFLDSLAGLIQKATTVTRKVKAARKLEECPEYRAQLAQQARQTQPEKKSALSKLFASYDVVETSYHFVSQKIVLHLSDDSGVSSCHPNLKLGGALQITVKRFQVDYYPYHLAKGDRKHWPTYREGVLPHTQWQEQSLNAFKTKFLDLVERRKVQHVPLSRKQGPGDGSPQSPQDHSRTQPQDQEIRNYVVTQFAKLMTACAVLRIEDFTIFRVTSGKNESLKEFISGDRERMALPEDASIVHAEFIYYYYPHDTPFPLPPPKFYVQVNPIQITFDMNSCLWFSAFALNLHQSLLDSKQDISKSDLTYIDVKVEAILPKIIFESSTEHHNQRDRPKSLQFQVTRATITNVRSLEQSSRADLAKCVDSFHMGSLFFGTDFPSESSDFYIVTQKFLDHISAKDDIRSFPEKFNVTSVDAMIELLSREMLWTEAKDVWCVGLDPIWGEFLGVRAVGVNKGVPLLDALPITIWLHSHLDPNSTMNKSDNSLNADIHVLAHISNLVSLQLNHYQYLFLMRLAEELAEMVMFLGIDANKIQKVETSSSLVVGALIPQVEITFVMPSQCPGKESSGGDAESFVPDSSSMGDEVLAGGSMATVWQTSTLSMTGMDTRKVQAQIANGAGVSLGDVSPTYGSYSSSHDNRSKAPADTFGNMSISNNINAGLSSMKKGFSSLVTSIDSALKPSADDGLDSMSIRSDVSSDSENYVLVQMGADDRNVESVDDMFFVKDMYESRQAVVEIASEVIEDDSEDTTPSDPSMMSSCRRKDLVSVATFKLNKVEFLQQSVGYSSSIKVQVGNISSEDCNSIPWDEFQSKFCSRSRAWTDGPSNDTKTRVKIRMDHNLILPRSQSLMQMDFGDKEVLKKLFQNLIKVQVKDLVLDLTMSTVTGLVDLAEDEIFPVPIPLQIVLENVQLNLFEDRPPTNITSPGPVPIHLDITQMYIVRDEDGVFRIYPARPSLPLSQSSSEHEDLTQLNRQLKADNDELKRRLMSFDRIVEENRTLRESKEENEMLRVHLTSAQDHVEKLIEEKAKLLNEIAKLREQFVPDKSRWNSKR